MLFWGWVIKLTITCCKLAKLTVQQRLNSKRISLSISSLPIIVSYNSFFFLLLIYSLTHKHVLFVSSSYFIILFYFCKCLTFVTWTETLDSKLIYLDRHLNLDYCALRRIEQIDQRATSKLMILTLNVTLQQDLRGLHIFSVWTTLGSNHLSRFPLEKVFKMM